MSLREEAMWIYSFDWFVNQMKFFSSDKIVIYNIFIRKLTVPGWSMEQAWQMVKQLSDCGATLGNFVISLKKWTQVIELTWPPNYCLIMVNVYLATCVSIQSCTFCGVMEFVEFDTEDLFH